MIKLFVHICSGIESAVDFIGFKKVIAGLVVIGLLVSILGPILVRSL